VEHAPAIAALIASVIEHLSAPQLRAWASLVGSRMVRLLCGRQAGKTRLVALWLLVGAMLMPESINLYLSLTKESAKRNIWPELRAVGAMLGLDDSCFKLHGGIVTLPNGSQVLVMGTDDTKTIESWRGPKLFRVAVDEMGAQPPEWVEYLIREILWWTVMRNNGAFLLAGNPGLLPHGYWYGLTKPGSESDPNFHAWTVRENPGIPHASEFIAETLAEFGWTEESPGYIRSVLGQWVHDPSAVVYPFTLERNGVDALPVFGAHDVIIPAKSWSFIVSASVADPETVAAVVWAWHRSVAGVFAVEAWSEALDPDAGIERVVDAVARHPGARCIVDPGELGEEHVMAIRRRWRLPAVVALKADKPSAIRETRGGVLSGAAKFVNGKATLALRDAWNVTGWHPRKRVLHDPARPDMLASAGAFGYRRVPPHSAPKDARPGSPDWQAQLIARTEAEVRTTARSSMGGAIGRLQR
jgi:hypothetical protein